MIICSNEEEEKSHFISKLYQFRRQYVPSFDEQNYKDYLAEHFTNKNHDMDDLIFQADSCMAASSVDHEQYDIAYISNAIYNNTMF